MAMAAQPTGAVRTLVIFGWVHPPAGRIALVGVARPERPSPHLLYTPPGLPIFYAAGARFRGAGFELAAVVSLSHNGPPVAKLKEEKDHVCRARLPRVRRKSPRSCRFWGVEVLRMRQSAVGRPIRRG